MSNKSKLAAKQRQDIETQYTFQRVIELELNPVVGNFDVAHLKEINRRIFQDLPGFGFEDVTPGEFRKTSPSGKDWIKNRAMETLEGSFFVAYSCMDNAAKARMDKTLEAANPDKLRALKIHCTQDRVGANRSMPDLLRDAVRPSRAAAFEQLTEKEALKEYSELKAAYKEVHTTSAYFESKMPDKPETQESSIQSVVDRIQKRLDAGEVIKLPQKALNKELNSPFTKQEKADLKAKTKVREQSRGCQLTK